MLTEASRIEDEAARKELVRHAMQSENAGKLKAMIYVASNLEGLIINPDGLDSDIWKLNCKNGVVDQRLLNSSMVEGIPEFGGYSVPEEYGAFPMDKSLESEIIRPRATVWAMGSETKKVPAFDGADKTNHLFGGISGEWLEEGQTGTRKVAKLRLI